MADSWLIWIFAASILISVVLLAVVCVRCSTDGPLVSIRQGNASEEDIHNHFRVILPSQSTDLPSIHLPSNMLSPSLSPADAGIQHRHPSFTPTETESNPSYENPVDGPDYINAESDVEDPGYIIVLPENETPLTNQSRASTPSSDVLHDYENVPEKKGDRDYLNVELQHFQRSTSDVSAQSDSSSDDDDDDDDDDDEGNYVNVPDRMQTN